MKIRKTRCSGYSEVITTRMRTINIIPTAINILADVVDAPNPNPR